MEYEILEQTSFYVIGISIRTDNTRADEIGKLWERFHSEHIKDKIPNKIDGEVLGVYCDYESDYTGPFTLIAGCRVSSLENVPEGMEGKEIKRGGFAHLRAEGEFPQCLVDLWKSVWDSDLQRNYTVDFEVYPEDFSFDHPKVDLFVGVQ